jgi:hypothetical protein
VRVDVHMPFSTIQMLAVMALTVSRAFRLIFLHSAHDIAAGEVCHEWQTWGDHFHIQSIFGHSLLQATIYVVLAVCYYNTFIIIVDQSISQVAFAGSAAVLVVTYAP